jgi:hypothetical protein
MSIESLLNNFFRVSEDHRNFFLIGWKVVCLRKEYEGLGVREMREFNTVLLGKWCWRMLVNIAGFWYRVLVARYGEEDERLMVGGRSGSSWWMEVV